MNTSHTRFGIVLTIVLLASAIAAALLWQGRSLLTITGEPADQKQLLSEPIDLFAEGKYDAATRQAMQIVEDSDGILNFAARTIAEIGYFMEGDVANKLTAIRKTKEHYFVQEGNSFDQALLVNKLVGYINPDSEDILFNEVFAGEPFEQFFVPGNKLESLRNLAEHSLSIYPTTSAYFEIGSWHADHILNKYNDWGLTDEEKDMQAIEILDNIHSADLLIENEKQILEERPFGYMIEPWYFFQKMSLYLAVAHTQPTYLEQARASLALLSDLYERERNAGNDRSRIIVTLIPYAHFDYAQAIYEIKGESALPEALAHLETAMDLIQESPALHEKIFLNSLREQGSLTQEVRNDRYGAYLIFAQENARFKIFLESHGWQFEF